MGRTDAQMMSPSIKVCLSLSYKTIRIDAAVGLYCNRSEKTIMCGKSYKVSRVPSFTQLRQNGLPGDMALTPRESLQLYDTMISVWPDCESLQVSGVVINISNL